MAADNIHLLKLACWLLAFSRAVVHAALDPPRVYVNTSGDSGRGQLVFEIPVPIVRWSASGQDLMYSYPFTSETNVKAFHGGNLTESVDTSWRLPYGVTFTFERNFLTQLGDDQSTRFVFMKNGYPEMRVPLQNSTRTAPRPLTSFFNFSEEVELDCVDRNTSADHRKQMTPSFVYYRAALNCSCDPLVDDTCFYCATSGRYYQLRFRQNMQLPVRVANFTMYLKDNVDAPFATSMGLKTTISLQGPQPSSLTDIRDGFSIDAFYSADWSPQNWDPFRSPRPLPQTYPNNTYDRLVKWIGKSYPQTDNSGKVVYPDDGSLNTTSLLDKYILTNVTEPGLIVSKTLYNQGYAAWTEGLVISPAEWKLRKSAACAAGRDRFLSTNYETLANRVNTDSNPIRQCVPLADRKQLVGTTHINELGYPADYPYAMAIPNPLVTTPLPEGQLLISQLYRLSCDFNKDFFAPVYYFTMNRTELEAADNPAVQWPPAAIPPGMPSGVTKTLERFDIIFCICTVIIFVTCV